MDAIKMAIANIDKKKKTIRASFVRGGSPGLKQQRLKNFPEKAREIGIVKSIKDDLKNNHLFEIVIIQVGIFYEVIEEDAKFFHDEFNFEIHDAGGTRSYEVTGFHLKSIEKYTQKLKNQNISFCVVQQQKEKISGYTVREVTDEFKGGQSDSFKSALGRTF